MKEAAALMFGYLLGSMLPAYFIGRLRRVDLRKEGTGNAGTTNAYHVLGLWPALVTAFYDVLKGVAAALFAWRLGVAQPFIYGAGIAAVVGHRFPFYLKFRGAEGVGASTGLLLASLVYSFYRGWFTLVDLLLLAGLVVGLWLIFRRGAVPGVVVLPIVYGLIAYRSRSLGFSLFLALVMGYIWAVNIWHVRREKLLRVRPETRAALRQLRVLVRPAAIAFPVLYLFVSKTTLLVLIGWVALFFIIVDVSRLLSRRLNMAVFARLPFFFRRNEERTFTSATLFLTGAFLTIYLFPKPEATAALVFVTFGDIFSKFTGLEHGKTRLFSRTIEGSLAYFASCAIAGFVWAHIVPLTPAQYVLGAAAAAVTELAPTGVNDNLTVPLISATVMTIPSFFSLPGF